jgi:phosphatidylserine/phosphatidylglycerophosphate/cardiolipin synthase-like enzyme
MGQTAPRGRDLLFSTQIAQTKAVPRGPARPSRHVRPSSAAGMTGFSPQNYHYRLNYAPFDHSKLMVVDGHWVLLGSANWDACSLRLNFELNVECYGRELARDLAAVIEKKLVDAREVTLTEVDARTIPGKLRDAAARLFSPYL